MRFDALTFNITLMNELENATMKRGTCNVAVERATKQNRHVRGYCAWVWVFERCSCESPVMRSFDKLGKVCFT